MVISRIEDANEECISCNWDCKDLYVVVSDWTEAGTFFDQNGGLCAECLLADLFSHHATIRVEQQENGEGIPHHSR